MTHAEREELDPIKMIWCEKMIFFIAADEEDFFEVLMVMPFVGKKVVQEKGYPALDICYQHLHEANREALKYIK